MTYVALGLSGPHLAELVGDAALLARWDALPLAYTVLGIDRIDGSPPSATTLDSSAVGAALAGRTVRGRFLIVASPHRDHPYNLARRVVSLGHLSGGRSGVLFGVTDGYAAASSAWGVPLTQETALEAARAVRALEQSWPYDSIIGDRETGILVESDRIVHVDLDGAYSIAGPLNAPEPATGPSVIAWYGDVPDRSVIDVTVGPLIRPAAEQGLDAVLSEVEALFAGGATPVRQGSLRLALDLPVPVRPAGARPAFAAPVPLEKP